MYRSASKLPSHLRNSLHHNPQPRSHTVNPHTHPHPDSSHLTHSRPSIPIPDSNGTYGLNPVLNGTISGPLINGTFTGGAGKGQFFADHFVGDDTQYGMTDDGEEFILTHYTSGSGKGIIFRAVSFFIFPTCVLVALLHRDNRRFYLKTCVDNE